MGEEEYNMNLQREISIFGKGGVGGVLDWWEKAIEHAPHIAGHRAAQRPWGEVAKTAPLYLHYDGAEVFRNQEYHIFSYGSLLCDVGSAFDRLFPILSVPNGEIADMREVQSAVAKLVKWSSDALIEGKWPETGPDGEDLDEGREALGGTVLAEGWRGAFIGFSADAKSRYEANCLPRYYKMTYLCESCLAQKPAKGGGPYHDLRGLQPRGEVAFVQADS